MTKQIQKLYLFCQSNVLELLILLVPLILFPLFWYDYLMLGRLKKVNWENRLSLLAIYYSIGGLIFAIIFALYYRWPWYGYFSPGFFAVFASWPYQIIGFVRDFMYYGLAGKPI